MAERTSKERKVLGTILLAISAFTGVMSLVYLIKFLAFGIPMNGSALTAIGLSVEMLYGAFLGVGMNYTIRVPRGKDDDRSQMIAWAIFIVLGTVIAASMHMILGVGEYILIPIVLYAQNWLMLLIALYSLKFYRHSHK